MELAPRAAWPVLAARSLFAVLLALTIWGSVAPPSAVATVFLVPDKVVHAGAYAALAFLLAASLRGRLVLAAVGMLAIGGALEIVQAVLGYRSGDWGDMAADAVGVAVGLGAYRLLAGRR